MQPELTTPSQEDHRRARPICSASDPCKGAHAATRDRQWRILPGAAGSHARGPATPRRIATRAWCVCVGPRTVFAQCAQFAKRLCPHYYANSANTATSVIPRAKLRSVTRRQSGASPRGTRSYGVSQIVTVDVVAARLVRHCLLGRVSWEHE